MTNAWRVFRNELAKMGRMKMIYLGPVCIVIVCALFSIHLARLNYFGTENGWSLAAQSAQLAVSNLFPFSYCSMRLRSSPAKATGEQYA